MIIGDIFSDFSGSITSKSIALSSSFSVFLGGLGKVLFTSISISTGVSTLDFVGSFWGSLSDAIFLLTPLLSKFSLTIIFFESF